MMTKKNVLCIIFTIIILTLVLTGCKDNSITYQNQFLNLFGIDFISTKYHQVEVDELKDYIYIELSEAEKTKMEKHLTSSDLFYSVTEKSNDYSLLIKTLENKFSNEIKNAKNGYFSIYNKIPEQIIDLSSSDLENIGMDYFTAIIYDSDNGIIYLFNYSVS